MRIAFFAFVFSTLTILQACASGAADDGRLVNEQEIAIGQINAIAVHYGSDSVAFLRHDSPSIIVREYIDRNDSALFADIRLAGNTLVVTGGRRPVTLMPFSIGPVRGHVEIFVPQAIMAIEITTSSGSIAIPDAHNVASFTVSNSSGRIRANSITADSVVMGNSSGGISINNIVADSVRIGSSSGAIEARSIEAGAADIKNSSGRITIDSLVAESAVVRTSSGRIGIDSIASGGAEINSSSGSIALGRIEGSARIGSSSGGVRGALGMGAGNVFISTTSGSVTLDLPRSLSFDFLSRSSSGSLRTSFDDRLFSSVSDRRLVQGSIGDDNEAQRTIEITTSSGSRRVNWVN